MKQPVVDYREFRFSRLNDPQFSHLKLLGGWIFYFVMYFITENLIPPEACHPIHCALDDMIPFCEYFLLAYCGWYFLVFGSLLYYFLYDIEGFKGLSKFRSFHKRFVFIRRTPYLYRITHTDKLHSLFNLGEDAVKNIGKLAQLFGDADSMGLKQAMLSTAGFSFSFLMMACSRPPPPTTNSFILHPPSKQSVAPISPGFPPASGPRRASARRNRCFQIPRIFPGC